ncbi:MAG TPA: glycerol-3-phosphate dehydrogenase/oxidase [Acidimicrobiales bacterium]|nr:glycerol-3-phosphate dehydrogenase/oxidase [Acidimicrobiales bacterium]
MTRLSSMAARTPFDRDRALVRMADEGFDVLVIGGGISGAGVALDAAARGLKTALVERRDWASGTSSRSSKLIHGGLRYLQQRDYKLVYEALAERQRLLENAPHLVSPLPFLIPLFGKEGAVNKAVARFYSTALWLYDVTGGLRIGKRHKRLGREEVLAHFPALNAERLVAGFLYWDAQADDARLTLTVARTAVVHYGAVAANYAGAVALLKDPVTGRVAGVRLEGGTEVRADAVVNAGGVWSDEVRRLDQVGDIDEGRSLDEVHLDQGVPFNKGRSTQGTLRPAKGIHLTFRAAALRCDMAAVLPVSGDRRSVFVVPWGEFTYVGTTDTDYDGPLDDPQCTPEDVAYLLGAVNASLTDPVTEDDVVGTWAGLRPLVRGAVNERSADLSRRHLVMVSDDGLVTVTGGKFTTYRRMAADAVDEVVRLLGRGAKRSPTRRLPLLGALGTPALRERDAASRLGIDPDCLTHLVGRYGSEARTVIAMTEADPELGRRLVPGLPYLRAEAVYAARYEMARTIDDVLARRTRALLLARDASAGAALDVARLVAPELGWSPKRVEQEVEDYRAAATRAREAAGLPGTDAALTRGN